MIDTFLDMRLPQPVILATLFSTVTTQFVAGTSVPRQINLGFVPNAADSIYSSFSAAFLNPAKSFHKYLQRPSLVSELQLKIITLEREIRSNKEEGRQLRALLNHQRADRRRNKSVDSKQSIEVERILRDQIKSLNSRIEELSQIKGEMDALLKQEKGHALKLQQMLQDEREEKAALVQKHRQELDDLHKQITTKSEEKMKKMEKDIVARMTLEIEKMKKDAQEALALEQAKNARLEKEKQEAEQAVEKEKIKMRKLVKVLANKEKQEIEARSSSNLVPITQTAASGKLMRTRKITSQRGSKPL